MTYDQQNPWFNDANNNTTTTPTTTTGGAVGQAPTPANTGMNQQQFNWAWGSVPQGATVTSQGPAWLNPQPMHNLSEALDPSKWHDWTDDQWRLWASGEGHNDVDTGLLANGLNQAQIANLANTYGATGSRYLGGHYDWTTGKMIYDPSITPEMIAAANARQGASAGQLTGGVGVGVLGPNGITIGPGGQYNNWFQPYTGARPNYTPTTTPRPGTAVTPSRTGPTNFIPTSPYVNGRPSSTVAGQLAREAAIIKQQQEAQAVKRPVTRPGSSTTVTPPVINTTPTRPSPNRPGVFSPVSRRYIED